MHTHASFRPSAVSPDGIPTALYAQAMQESARYSLRHPAHVTTVAVWVLGTLTLILVGAPHAYAPAMLGAVATLWVRRYLTRRFLREHYLR